MAITPLPTPPSTSDPANFDARADAFLGALPQFATECNAAATDLGGAQFIGSSSSSVAIGTGSKSFTATTGLSWAIGQPLMVASAANPANYMTGQVTAYNSGTGALTVNVASDGGSGTHTDWVISPVPVDGSTAYTGSLATPGWRKAPDGYMEQWGMAGPFNSEGVISVTFPQTFPTAIFDVQLTMKLSSGGGANDYWPQYINETTNGVDVWVQLAPGPGSTTWPVNVAWRAYGK
jgi:hypothetical protein